MDLGAANRYNHHGRDDRGAHAQGKGSWTQGLLRCEQKHRSLDVEPPGRVSVQVVIDAVRWREPPLVRATT